MKLTRTSAPTVPFQIGVPKVIHQTFGSLPTQPALVENIRTMKAVNPAWEHRFYDDGQVRDYLLTHYGAAFVAHFDALNPRYAAARADLFRYALLYREGGAYFDIKSRPARPLDEVIRPDDAYLLSHWPQEGAYAGWGNPPDLRRLGLREYQQWFIVAAPGHPYLKAVLDTVLERIRRYHPLKDSIGKPAVLRTTGPFIYTQTIAAIREQHPHRLVDSAKDLGFDYSIYPAQTHQAALGAHYSETAEALVTTGFAAAPAARLRRELKALLKRA